MFKLIFSINLIKFNSYLTLNILCFKYIEYIQSVTGGYAAKHGRARKTTNRGMHFVMHPVCAVTPVLHIGAGAGAVAITSTRVKSHS